MKPRTQGAIALMSAGNLEVSWYFLFLSNQSVVKRTKATPLPMSDEVITHLNSLSVNRKINETSNYILIIIVDFTGTDVYDSS